MDPDGEAQKHSDPAETDPVPDPDLQHCLEHKKVTLQNKQNGFITFKIHFFQMEIYSKLWC